MSFGQNRLTIEPGAWTKICEAEDANVTVENFGVGAYQFVHIISGSSPPPDGGDPIGHFRTLRPQEEHTFTNLDEGTVLWAKATTDPVVIEVLTG